MTPTPSALPAAPDGLDGNCPRLRSPLAGPRAEPPLYLPIGPFCGFHHLSYKHYLATEHDRNLPGQAGPMPPLDAYALISE